jgi:uncharacterized Tic20 family protein
MSNMDGTDQGSGTGQTQPGWYPDPSNGQLRWWDGSQWGQFQSADAVPMATAPGTVNPSASQAALAHYLGAGLLFLTCGLGWLGPLIIYMGQGATNDAYVKDQAREALNFQITIAGALIISSILTIVVIGLALLPIVWIVGVIFGVIGGMAASKGESYRYPFSIKLVK